MTQAEGSCGRSVVVEELWNRSCGGGRRVVEKTGRRGGVVEKERTTCGGTPSESVDASGDEASSLLRSLLLKGVTVTRTGH